MRTTITRLTKGTVLAAILAGPHLTQAAVCQRADGTYADCRPGDTPLALPVLTEADHSHIEQEWRRQRGLAADRAVREEHAQALRDAAAERRRNEAREAREQRAEARDVERAQRERLLAEALRRAVCRRRHGRAGR